MDRTWSNSFSSGEIADGEDDLGLVIDRRDPSRSTGGFDDVGAVLRRTLSQRVVVETSPRAMPRSSANCV